MFKRIAEWLGLVWRLLRVYWQVIWGAWRVSSLEQPVVSIFGGAKFKQEDFYARQAFALAQKCAQAGISVLTGGGPGIMEAANCGVMPQPKKGEEVGTSRGKTIGIGVKDLDEYPNPCAHETIVLDYFFARKWLLTRYAAAVVVFPGGFGTLDELLELVTLIQTKKTKKVPVILVGTEFWQPLFEWMVKEPLRHGLIGKEDLRLFVIVDDLEQVFCLIRDKCNGYEKNN